MAKAKKEFKSRVRKLQKHVKALLELAVHDDQREALYETQHKLDWMESTQGAYFDDPEQGSEPPPDVREARRGPQPVAG